MSVFKEVARRMAAAFAKKIDDEIMRQCDTCGGIGERVEYLSTTKAWPVCEKCHGKGKVRLPDGDSVYKAILGRSEQINRGQQTLFDDPVDAAAEGCRLATTNSAPSIPLPGDTGKLLKAMEEASKKLAAVHKNSPEVYLMTKAHEAAIRKALGEDRDMTLSYLFGIPYESYDTQLEVMVRAAKLALSGVRVGMITDDAPPKPPEFMANGKEIEVEFSWPHLHRDGGL